MKVKILECISGSDCFYKRGDEADFAESTARAYAALGVVELLEEAQETVPSPERTADKPGRKKQ